MLIDVIWCLCSELVKGETGKCWMCVQYFVIASCGWMPRENSCVWGFNLGVLYVCVGHVIDVFSV